MSSPTYSLWSTTCADTRCPWVVLLTSNLCSVSTQPRPHLRLRLVTVSTLTGWAMSCTSLMDKLGILCVCQFALLSFLAVVMCTHYFTSHILQQKASKVFMRVFLSFKILSTNQFNKFLYSNLALYMTLNSRLTSPYTSLCPDTP